MIISLFFYPLSVRIPEENYRILIVPANDCYFAAEHGEMVRKLKDWTAKFCRYSDGEEIAPYVDGTGSCVVKYEGKKLAGKMGVCGVCQL